MTNQIFFFWEDLPYKVAKSTTITYDTDADTLAGNITANAVRLYANGVWNELQISADGSVSASVVS